MSKPRLILVIALVVFPFSMLTSALMESRWSLLVCAVAGGAFGYWLPRWNQALAARRERRAAAVEFNEDHPDWGKR